MIETSLTSSKAAELRQAFDRAFAILPPAETAAVEDFLTIRLAGDPFAIPLRDIALIVAGRPVISIPAATPNLLGLAGIRGGVVPVFGLPSILGYPEAQGSLSWMILCGGDEPIALAFSDFEGYVRLARSSLGLDKAKDANTHGRRPYVSHIASTLNGIRSVISIPLIVATIRNRIGQDRPSRGVVK